MITNSKIGWGDQLGAQLTTLAEMVYISEESDQPLVFWEELRSYRRGYQFMDYFDIAGITLVHRYGRIVQKVMQSYYGRYRKIGSWQKQMKKIYQNRIHNILDRIIYRLIRFRYGDFVCKKGNIGGVHAAPEILELSKSANYDIQDGFGTYQDWKKYESEIKKDWFSNRKSRQKQRISIGACMETKRRLRCISEERIILFWHLLI